MKLTAFIRSTGFRLILAVAALAFIAARVQWQDRPAESDHHASQAAPLTKVAEGSVLGEEAGTIYGIPSIWVRCDKKMLFIGLAVFSMVPALQAVRLRWMLNRHHSHISFVDALSISIRGNFMNFAAPFGSTAGDVCKAYWIAQRTGKPAESTTLIMLDRAVGLATLLFGVALVIVFLPNARLVPFRMFVTSSCIAISVALYIYLSPRFRNLWASVRDRFRLIARIDATLILMLRDSRLMFGSIAVTVVIHLAAALAFACAFAALALSFTDGPAAFYASFSIGELVKAIPGPPQGLGTMELAYEWLFAGSGSVSRIVTAALIIRAFNLICAIPGAALLFLEKRSPATDSESTERRSAPDLMASSV